jgi:uncharacterized membrane protein YkgB
LTVAQVGFLIGQTYFIASNLQSVFKEAFNLNINILWFGFLCFIVTTPLSYVREIEKFAFSYVLADILILATTLVILGFSTYKLTNEGWGKDI